jgi:hypothetical protein
MDKRCDDDCQSLDDDQQQPRSIVLPCDQVFRNLENAKRFAIDIGIVEYITIDLMVFIQVDHLLSWPIHRQLLTNQIHK